MWNRILAIMRKEFTQTVKDPRSRALLIGPPLLQLILFGYAVNLDVENARMAWVDMDRTSVSRELRAAFSNSRYFQIIEEPSDDRNIKTLMDHGKVQLTVHVLPGFAHDIKRGKSALVQILIDGTNSNTAAILSNYAVQVVTAYAAQVSTVRPKTSSPSFPSATGPPISWVVPKFTSENRVWFNPDLRSRVYFVPGVIVNIIALVTIMLTAMSIVREKELGTMEQLMVTPIRPLELIVGKLLPFALVGIWEVAFVVIAALLVFHTPLRGSIPLLFLCSVFYLFSTLGVGLFISTISQTQQQAMMASFFFFMPAMLLSGFAFPIRNMPPAVQILTYLNPLRYFVQITRSLFLKGTGLNVLYPEILALFIFGIMILTVSVLRFRKTLD
jgi:ABC-2 type transport system permease protein